VINDHEAAQLYKLMTARRPRQGPVTDADLDYLMIMSQDGGWDYRQAVRAFVEHGNNHPGEFFEAGHITQRVKEVRKEIRARWYCPDPPRELAEDPRAEIEWRRRACDVFTDRNLALWASGQPLEKPEVALQLKPVPLTVPQQGDSAERRAARAQVRQLTAKTVVPKVYGKEAS
jgi:hypothetical protein